VAKNTPTPTTATRSRSALPRADESALQDQKALAGRTLRTIFYNVFRHNSLCLNSAKYEARWRFTINICWREGEPVPCPAAVSREKDGRGGHQAEIEFSISAIEPTLTMRMRVDDASLVESFPSIPIRRGYAKELRVLLKEQFGLDYPKVEEEPVG
jgi:hypothetical protein